MFTELCGRAIGKPEPGIGTALLSSFASFIGVAPDAIADLTGLDPSDTSAREKLGALAWQRFFPME
jgi:hypothetical protein